MPFQNIFKKIIDFFVGIFIGRFLFKFIEWFQDPENKKKIDAIGKFLSDHWPKLLAAYLLFGNSFGRFVVKMAASLVKFTAKLLTKVLPGLLKFIAANPALAALAGVTALGVAAVAQNQKGTAVIKDPDDPDKSQMDETREFGGMSGDPFGGLFNGGGQVPTQWPYFNGGGKVPGRGPNRDTVPAMLSPGEFVMSRGAVDKWGSGMLALMNSAGGGDNKPKMFGGTTYAAGGGMIGGEHREKMSAEHGRLMAQRDKAVQAPGGIDTRHNELMQSTDPQKISDYDKKHGEGAYSKKLREKLTKIYVVSPQQKKSVMPQSTGKVLEGMDAQRAVQKEGDQNIKVTGPLLGRLVMGSGLLPSLEGLPGMGGGGGGTNALTNQAKVRSIPGMLGSLFDGFRKKKIDPQTILEDVKSKARNFATSMGGTIKDGNIGQMSREEERAFKELERKKAKLAESQQRLNALRGGISPPSQPPVTVIPAPQGQSAPSAPQGSGSKSSGDVLPNFSASGNSRDRSRTSKILGIF